MSELLAKCGARCSRCPAFRGNVRGFEDQQRCSDGWHRILGVRLQPDRCICDGCQTPDDLQPTLVIGRYGCSVRQCAVKNGVPTCAHCSGYPCLAVQRQFSFDAGTRDRIAKRRGGPVPDDEYLTFIEPYECRRHLDEIRAGLSPEEIVEMTKLAVKPKLAGFPQHLPASPRTMALRALRRLIGEVGNAAGVSYAEQAILQERRRRLVKLLWAFGLYGKQEPDGGPWLGLDADTYLTQKITSDYAELMGFAEILSGHGVRCELIPLVEKGWRTPRGSLRKQGWRVRISLDDAAGGREALGVLQAYARELDERHGKGAFRRFSRADMRDLSAG